MEKRNELYRVDTAHDTLYDPSSRQGSNAPAYPQPPPPKRLSGLQAALHATTRWGIKREDPQETLRANRHEMHRLHDMKPGSSTSSFDAEKKAPLVHTDTAMTSFDDQAHTGILYREDGQVVLQPAPTQDPRDPLNLSTRRKIIALCELPGADEAKFRL